MHQEVIVGLILVILSVPAGLALRHLIPHGRDCDCFKCLDEHPERKDRPGRLFRDSGISVG
jgi:hypothetical protein